MLLPTGSVPMGTVNGRWSCIDWELEASVNCFVEPECRWSRSTTPCADGPSTTEPAAIARALIAVAEEVRELRLVLTQQKES
jgi:hypothetical protein